MQLSESSLVVNEVRLLHRLRVGESDCRVDGLNRSVHIHPHERVEVPLHEQRVGARQGDTDGDVGVAAGKRYAPLDEVAVVPRPGCEGAGSIVGRSDCTSHTQRASSKSSP